MSSKKESFPWRIVIWAVLITGSVILSAATYGTQVVSGFTSGNSMCSIAELNSGLSTLLEPYYWLGWFTVILLAGFARHWWSRSTSRWALLSDLQLPLALVALFLVALVFSSSCKPA